MKKLSKEQIILLEHALDNLYAFLRNMYKVHYSGNIFCYVYDDIIHLNQYSLPNNISWFADIVLKDRKIYISIRETKREIICSKIDYELFYMDSKPKIHTVLF